MSFQKKEETRRTWEKKERRRHSSPKAMSGSRGFYRCVLASAFSFCLPLSHSHSLSPPSLSFLSAFFFFLENERKVCSPLPTIRLIARVFLMRELELFVEYFKGHTSPLFFSNTHQFRTRCWCSLFVFSLSQRICLHSEPLKLEMALLPITPVAWICWVDFIPRSSVSDHL